MKSNIALFFGITVICALCFLAGMINQQHIVSAELSNYPIYINDIEAKSEAERPPLRVYVKIEKRYFYPGQIVSSKENGTLILWDSTTMPKSWIVGIISDSGTVEYSPFKIMPHE